MRALLHFAVGIAALAAILGVLKLHEKYPTMGARTDDFHQVRR